MNTLLEDYDGQPAAVWPCGSCGHPVSMSARDDEIAFAAFIEALEFYADPEKARYEDWVGYRVGGGPTDGTHRVDRDGRLIPLLLANPVRCVAQITLDIVQCHTLVLA